MMIHTKAYYSVTISLLILSIRLSTKHYPGVPDICCYYKVSGSEENIYGP